MYNLLNACVHKYLKSTSARIILAVSFASGLACGFLFQPNSSESMMLAAAPVIISVALVVMNISKEWEFRTFANKLIIGHTKEKIFFSELIVALAAGAAVYALFGVGFAAASPKTVFGPRWSAILRISALMALAGLSLCAMAAVISFICKTHNSAMILSLAAIFVMFFVSEQLYEFIFINETRSEVYESYYSNAVADPVTGKYVDPTTGIAVEKEDYVPTRVIKLAKAAYELNPIGALDLYINEIFPYLDGELPDQYNLYPRSLPLCSAGLTAMFAAFGALAFRKKDVN